MAIKDCYNGLTYSNPFKENLEGKDHIFYDCSYGQETVKKIIIAFENASEISSAVFTIDPTLDENPTTISNKDGVLEIPPLSLFEQVDFEKNIEKTKITDIFQQVINKLNETGRARTNSNTSALTSSFYALKTEDAEGYDKDKTLNERSDSIGSGVQVDVPTPQPKEEGSSMPEQEPPSSKKESEVSPTASAESSPDLEFQSEGRPPSALSDGSNESVEKVEHEEITVGELKDTIAKSGLPRNRLIALIDEMYPEEEQEEEALISLKSKVTSFLLDVKETIQNKAIQVLGSSKTLFSSTRILRNTITKISNNKTILAISLVATCALFINPILNYFKPEEVEKLTTLEHIIRGLKWEFKLFKLAMQNLTK